MSDLYSFLSKEHGRWGVSQSKLIEQAISDLMSETQQWENGLLLMASDEEYLKEQEEIAEELIEDVYED